MFEKLKSYLADDALFYTLLLILVSVVSFGLGRASVLDTEKMKPVVVNTEYKLTELAVPVSETVSETELIASKSGSKYHLPTCPGAKQIKQANLISFASVAAAEAAGYTPAANCPGL